MYSIYINKEKNRIYGKLGAIATGEGERMLAEVKALLPGLKPGFTGVSDISAFSFSDPGEAVWAEKILQTMADAGLSRAIRVVGRETPYQEVKETMGYLVGTAKTIQDADAILDRLSLNTENPQAGK